MLNTRPINLQALLAGMTVCRKRGDTTRALLRARNVIAGEQTYLKNQISFRPRRGLYISQSCPGQPLILAGRMPHLRRKTFRSILAGPIDTRNAD